MLTTQQARKLTDAGQARADALGVPVIVAVLDAGAHLKALVRMDRAVLGSIDVATSKARTSVLFQLPSEAVWEYCKPGAAAPGLERSNGGLATFPGGLPLFNAQGALLRCGRRLRRRPFARPGDRPGRGRRGVGVQVPAGAWGSTPRARVTAA